MTDKYLFGDTELATRRLGVLAEAFGGSSRAFITAAAGDERSLAVDLAATPTHERGIQWRLRQLVYERTT